MRTIQELSWILQLHEKNQNQPFSQKGENHPPLEIISHHRIAFAMGKLQETNLLVPT